MLSRSSSLPAKSKKSCILLVSIPEYHYLISMAGESLELVDRGAGTSIDTGSVEQRDAQSSSPEPQAPGPEFSLPPVDSGKQAWMFLAACWAVEALVFGEYLVHVDNSGLQFSILGSHRGMTRFRFLVRCLPGLLQP